MSDDEEGAIKDFFFPIDYQYKGGSFDDNDTKLKDLLRHQISQSLKNKSSWAYKIDLTTIYKQKLNIGYFETRLESKPNLVLSISRFYIYKFHRKFNYTEKALKESLSILFEKYSAIKNIYFDYFESNRKLTTLLVKLKFILSKQQWSPL